MRTHLHVVVGVPGDPNPDKILSDFKAYGTRRLNAHWERPPSETWWTSGGSKRKLPDDRSVEAAVEYIRRQPNPLLIWTREDGVIYRWGERAAGAGWILGGIDAPQSTNPGLKRPTHESGG